MNRKYRTEHFRNEVTKEWYSWAYPHFYKAPVLSDEYEKEMELFFTREFRHYLAAYRIQQHYLAARLNPFTHYGINKINSDYEEYLNN